MTLLTIFESLVLAGWSFIVLYGFVVSLISSITKQRAMPLIFPRHVFALIIPTENDEGIIGKTVEHLRRLNYPRNMFEVVVAPVNSKDQTTTIARKQGAIVYGPGKTKWENRDDAIMATLDRLSSKDRFDSFIVLDSMARLSPNYLNVLSDELSKGALIIQSGYQILGTNWSPKTGLRALLAALCPSWLSGWSDRFRLGGGLRRIGFCLSRRVIDKYKISRSDLTNLPAYAQKLLNSDVVITFAPAAKVYDRYPILPAVQSLYSRWQAFWDQTRHHAVHMIKEGIEWKSIAQVLGGVNSFLPSFTGMVTITGLFLTLAVYMHGMKSALALGWLFLSGSLALLVVLRLIYIRAPLISYAMIPSVPLFLWWRALSSCFITPVAESHLVEPAQEKFTSNKRRSRQRKSPQKQTKRQPSLDD